MKLIVELPLADWICQWVSNMTAKLMTFQQKCLKGSNKPKSNDEDILRLLFPGKYGQKAQNPHENMTFN